MVFDFKPTIKEEIIYDDNGVKITAIELTYKNNDAYLKLKIDNNSEKNLSISSSTLGYSANAISGYMIDDGFLSEDIPAGASVEKEISFSTKELMVYGITQIANIDIGFTITDEEYNSIYTEPIRILTSVAEDYNYEKDTYQESIQNNPIIQQMGGAVIDFEVKEIYNDGNISVISQAIVTNQDGEKNLLLEIKNDSDDHLGIEMKKVYLNGELAYDYFWKSESINAHTRRVVRVDLENLLELVESKLTLEEVNSIKTLVSVEDKNGNEITMGEEMEIELSKK